jgi:predicted RNA-binding protein with PIN domain
VIVDGNNVIGCRPDGWWRDRPGASRRLVERLGTWAAAEGRSVVVVFDGAPPDPPPAALGVDVRWAARRGPDAADDVIVALVAAAPAGEELEVVTSDAGLAARVRAHGARVTGARTFRDLIDPPDGGGRGRR